MAHETLHAMNGPKKGKKGYLALKLDISKAYDRVEWNFLQGIMVKMGFPEPWVDRVTCCVTTSIFSILINGKPYGHITPSRGLRQGDPLSPCFLYVQRASLHSYKELKLKGEYKECLYVVELQELLIYCLQMIHCYFVKPTNLRF